MALVGSCLVRSLSASADLPQVQPPGPVRLVPIFTERPHPTVPVTIGLGGVGAAAAAPTAPLAGYDPSWVDPDEYLTREMREAREAAKEAEESKQAIEESRAAELEFLRSSIKRDAEARAKVSEDAVGFIPSGDAPPHEEAGLGSAMPAKLRTAVRKLGMAGRLGSAPGRIARRPGDPRNHQTTQRGSGDGDDASIFKNLQDAQGTLVDKETAQKRSGVAAAQELARKIRWGTAGEVADLTGVAIGEGGARLLSFVLPRARVLCELRLSRAAIGDKGAGYVCSALRMMTTLRLVDMRSCLIGPAGGVALAGAVEVGCVGLRCLLLGGNELGPKGVAAILSALPRNTHLARLDLERTGAAFHQTPLARNGDQVRLARGRVLHLRSGRSVPRADGGDPMLLEGRTAVLHGLRSDLGVGQLVDLRSCARPALEAAFLSVGSNGVVEALLGALSQPLRALRHLHLGGNSFGVATRKEVSRAFAAGPNAAAAGGAISLQLGAAGDPAADAAREAAELEARALAAAEEKDADAAIALAASAKLWTKGRTGTLPPEPSAMSLATIEMEASGLQEMPSDDEEVDEEALARKELPPELTLQRSQTMGSMQSASFSLTGARVASGKVPPAGSGF